jgi:integrase/recombinase XerD
VSAPGICSINYGYAVASLGHLAGVGRLADGLPTPRSLLWLRARSTAAPSPPPRRHRPRIQDLRHTFICTRVKLWQRDGADIDHAMIALSTYVGHAEVSDTYWYLTAVPDLMAVAAKNFEKYSLKTKEACNA